MKNTILSTMSLLAAGVLVGGCGADAGGESDGVAAEGPNVSGVEEVGEAQQALTSLVLPLVANADFEFETGPNKDLYVIKKAETGSGTTEVHVLTAASNYTQFSVHTGTGLHPTNANWEMEIDKATGDLYAIALNGTGSGKTEIHALSASSNWQTFTVHTATAFDIHLPLSDFKWQLAANRDLFLIDKRGTGVRAAQAASNWQAYNNVHQTTALHATGAGWDFDLAANRNVVALSQQGASGSTEAHSLSASTDYQFFAFQTATELPPGDAAWQYDVTEDCQLFAIKRWGTPSGQAELKITQLTSAVCGNAAPPAAEAITVNASAVVRSTATRPVGINLNYLVDDEASRPAGSPRTLSQALGDMKARFLRFPGGEKSDNYVWTTVSSTDSALVTPSTTIPDPLTPRVADPSHWPGNGSYADATTGIFDGPNVDFDEFMTLCQANGAEPVIVVAYDQAREITGLTTGPTMAELISSAAAWVKYANVTKGYNIRYWSIGNESWFRTGQTASIYAAHVNQFAAAMRQVDPTIKIGAHGNSTAWFNTVIANSSSAIDWLDVHDYPTYDWATGYDVFRLSNQTLTADVDKAIASIAAAPLPADQTRLTVGVTETNTIDWANGPNYTWPHVNDLGHALVTFDMIGQQLSKPKVEFTQLWNTRWIRNASYTPGTVPNAVVNPDFESNLDNWSGSGGVITTSSVYSGTKALQGNSGAFVYQDISLGAGNVLTFTAYARTSDASIWSGVGVDFLDSSGTKIDGDEKQITSTSYGKYSLPLFTTPAGTTTVRVWLYVGSGATAFLDKIVLTDRREPEVYDALAPDNSYLPAGRVMALWGQFLRDDLVQGSRSDSVIAYASRSTTDNTLSVWLLNKQTAPVSVNLTLNNYTPAASASAWRFAGSGPSDFTPTYTSLPAVAVPGNVMPIILPRTSITVLVFSPL